MDLEALYSGLKAATFIVGFLAAGLGAATWFTETRLRARSAERVRVLERGVADARTRQAEAEARLLALRAAMADRRLTTEQKHFITEAVRPLVKPDLIVWIRSDRGDDEAGAIADDIAGALREAGVTTEIRRDATFNFAPGIETVCGDRPFLVALIEALRTRGRQTVTPLHEFGCGSETGINVGPKPAPRPDLPAVN